MNMLSIDELGEDIYRLLSQAENMQQMEEMIEDISVEVTKAQYKVIDETGLWEGELK